MHIATIFRDKRSQVERQASRLIEMLDGSHRRLVEKSDIKIENAGLEESQETLHAIFEKIRKDFDRKEGGFGSAPKFPATMILEYLMKYAFHTSNQEAFDHVFLSLHKMWQGGIYDHLEGGFARYSTDPGWLVPHFEKMLYDNALLIHLYADAFKRTKDESFKRIVYQTTEFIISRMMHEGGGFYSAFDADSEGVEGKYYVWEKEEIEKVLGPLGEEFCAFYRVSKEGNWEGKNILHTKETLQSFAYRNDLDKSEFRARIESCIGKLAKVRAKRIPPGLDNKIILSWNALMNIALTSAFKAFGDSKQLEVAQRNMNFILEKFTRVDSWRLYRTWKGKGQYDAYLDDYATLIKALVDLFMVSFNESYLTKALFYSDHVIAEFYDQDENLFYFNQSDQEDIPIRKIELYDNATPSGNAVMVENLQKLFALTGKPEYREMVNRILGNVHDMIRQYPRSFGHWANVFMDSVIGLNEIVIVGQDAFSMVKELQKFYIPGAIWFAAVHEEKNNLLTRNREVQGATMIYVCKDMQCKMPVETIEEFKDLMHLNCAIKNS
jgi:uncharacterized protein YyaL (SSP411 family)